jgi:hypothetical protein
MTQADFSQALAQFEKELRRSSEHEVRKRWRDRGLIFVKEYTVKPHFRRKVN